MFGSQAVFELLTKHIAHLRESVALWLGAQTATGQDSASAIATAARSCNVASLLEILQRPAAFIQASRKCRCSCFCGYGCFHVLWHWLSILPGNVWLVFASLCYQDSGWIFASAALVPGANLGCLGFAELSHTEQLQLFTLGCVAVFCTFQVVKLCVALKATCALVLIEGHRLVVGWLTVADVRPPAASPAAQDVQLSPTLCRAAFQRKSRVPVSHAACADWVEPPQSVAHVRHADLAEEVRTPHTQTTTTTKITEDRATIEITHYTRTEEEYEEEVLECTHLQASAAFCHAEQAQSVQTGAAVYQARSSCPAPGPSTATRAPSVLNCDTNEEVSGLDEPVQNVTPDLVLMGGKAQLMAVGGPRSVSPAASDSTASKLRPVDSVSFLRPRPGSGA